MAPPNRRPSRKKREWSTLEWAAVDGAVTAAFMLFSSIFGEVASMLAPYVDVPDMALGVTVLILGLIVFDAACKRLGAAGSNFNPSTNVAFLAAGEGSAHAHGLRMVGQAAGAAAGSLLALSLVPKSWQGQFSGFGLGVRPGVSLGLGVLCEMALGFLLNSSILLGVNSGNKWVEYWAPLLVTVPLVLGGAALTGPSLNPAYTFGWFVHLRGHDLWEHILVYWAGPVAGALLAGWFWRAAQYLSAPRRRQQRRDKKPVPGEKKYCPPKQKKAANGGAGKKKTS